MRRASAVLLLLVPALASGQADLRIESTAGTVTVRGIIAGSAAYPADRAIGALGGTFARDPRGGAILLFGDTIRLTTFSALLQLRGEVHQLAFPVTERDGVVHLPEQFFIEWLPARFPAHVRWAGGSLRGAGPAVAAAPAKERAGGTPGAATPPPAPPPAPPRREPPVVIVDAGHGGRDPGKIGPNRLREKDVTLALARRLRDLLETRGYKVHMTRTTDTLIALDDRPVLANRWKGGRPAALFVSIHANSVARGDARGFETFFLSEARTEDERRVAEMENAAVEFEDVPPNGSSELDHILAGLRNDYYVRASSELAEIVQEELALFHTGPNRGVKRGGLRVLIGALMPAVLVEVAFISNRREADLLGTSAFQDKLAWGMAQAIDRFFARNGHLLSAGSQ